MRTGYLRLQPAGLGIGGGVYEVDAQLGAVHEDVHAHRYFGPPKDGRSRNIDLPVFLAQLLSERVETVGGRPLLFANRRGEPISRHVTEGCRATPATGECEAGTAYALADTSHPT